MDEIKRLQSFSSIKDVIEAVADVAYRRYLKIRRLTREKQDCDELWNKLNIDKISNIKIKNGIVSQRLQQTLIDSMDEYRKYLNDSIDGLLNIGILTFHSLIESDDNYKIETMKLLNDDFVEQHNQLITNISKDVDIGIPNAIRCIVENTTQNQYRFWRQRVCETIHLLVDLYAH